MDAIDSWRKATLSGTLVGYLTVSEQNNPYERHRLSLITYESPRPTPFLVLDLK